MKRPVYCALVHHPVRDKAGETVTTSVTNLDVHDIARSTRTYDLAGYFIVTPISAQHRIVERILEHWKPGAPGAGRVPQRAEALARITLARSVEEAITGVEEREGERPQVWVTGARAPEGHELLSFEEGAARLAAPEKPVLILFGTGHGLTRDLVDASDAVLAPIRGNATYNHLSVRAAVAIIFDRLFGER